MMSELNSVELCKLDFDFNIIISFMKVIKLFWEARNKMLNIFVEILDSISFDDSYYKVLRCC